MTSPNDPVAEQVEAYNAHDLDRFCACYTDDVEMFTNDDFTLKGMTAFRERYAARLATPGLQASILSRKRIGDFVFDEEFVIADGLDPVHAVAVYHLRGNKIDRVRFYR